MRPRLRLVQSRVARGCAAPRSVEWSSGIFRGGVRLVTGVKCTVTRPCAWVVSRVAVAVGAVGPPVTRPSSRGRGCCNGSRWSRRRRRVRLRFGAPLSVGFGGGGARVSGERSRPGWRCRRDCVPGRPRLHSRFALPAVPARGLVLRRGPRGSRARWSWWRRGSPFAASNPGIRVLAGPRAPCACRS